MKDYKTAALLVLFVFFVSCSNAKNNDDKMQSSDKNGTTETDVSKQKNKKMTHVLMQTSLGDITIALYDDTPKHKENFLKLVNEHYYDSLLFHRVIQNFMVQTGDPDSKNAGKGAMLGNGGPGYTIPAEFIPQHYHKRGAVAAARQGDNVNPAKASSGSQFYIVDGRTFSTAELNTLLSRTGKNITQQQVSDYTTIGGAPHLDGEYTVFGEVVSGMEVVDKIAAQQKNRYDRPNQDILIISAKVTE